MQTTAGGAPPVERSSGANTWRTGVAAERQPARHLGGGGGGHIDDHQARGLVATKTREPAAAMPRGNPSARYSPARVKAPGSIDDVEADGVVGRKRVPV